VASALLIGLFLGQFGINVPGPMKSAFFLLFLFTTGYAVGPQFFQACASSGVKQVIFALIICTLCFLSTFLMAKLAGYNAGQAGGLFAGAQTISGALGVVPETIQGNPDYTQAQKDAFIGAVPVVYSITYIFGAAGSAFLLGIVGPWLLGGLPKMKQEVKEIEESMTEPHASDASLAIVPAYRAVTYRSYHVTAEWFAEAKRTVADLEKQLTAVDGDRLFVVRMRHSNHLGPVSQSTVIARGDDVVIAGRREYALEAGALIGPETSDYELLNFPTEKMPVLIHKKSVAGKSVGEVLNLDCMYGVLIKRIKRSGVQLPVRPSTVLEAGDVVELSGIPVNVEKAVKVLGYANRPTNITDVVFLCLGIVVGVYIGTIMIKAGKIPISLGSSGGVLLAGLIMGWLRSKKPTYGAIPDGAVWLMRTLGLSMYVAIIGIAAAPSFASSLHDIGFSVLLYGAVSTSVPILAGIFIGKYIFKFKGPITLGCIAGSRTSTPSLGAITDQLNSDIPTIGYSLTYAVGVVVNLIGALLIVLLLA
jgi:putative transport protein